MQCLQRCSLQHLKLPCLQHYTREKEPVTKMVLFYVKVQSNAYV